MKKLKVKGHKVTVFSDDTIRIDWKGGKQPHNHIEVAHFIFDYLEQEGFIESSEKSS